MGGRGGEGWEGVKGRRLESHELDEFNGVQEKMFPTTERFVSEKMSILEAVRTKMVEFPRKGASGPGSCTFGIWERGVWTPFFQCRLPLC